MAAKKPADRKNARHAKSEKFVFETDEARLELPFVENLPVSVIDAQQDAETEAEGQKIMFDILFEDQRDEYRKLTLGELADLFEQWNAESSMDLGSF